MSDMDLDKYTYKTTKGDVKLTPESVRKYLTQGKIEASDTEIMLFLSMCKYNKINPFLGEAWLIKYSKDKPASIVIARNLLQSRAAEFEKYDGMQSGVILVVKDAILEREGSFHLPSEQLVGGWAIGYRKDWEQPRKITVSFDEYKPNYAGGLWENKPGTMIVKVAEAQLLRAIIPGNFEGAYTPEELQTDETEMRKNAPDIRDVSENPEVAGNLRKEIAQLLEDNADAIEERAALDWSISAADSVLIADLVQVRDNLKLDIKNFRSRENRAISKEETKEFFEKRKEEQGEIF